MSIVLEDRWRNYFTFACGAPQVTLTGEGVVGDRYENNSCSRIFSEGYIPV
jgi:hypothetical protein